MTELTYTLDASHIAAYQKLASERASNMGQSTAGGFDSAGQLLAACVAVAVPLAALDLLLPLATGRPFAYSEFFLGLIIGVGLVTWGLWLRYRKMRRQFVCPGGPTLSEHRLKLGGDGLRTSSAFFENICRWRAIEDATVHETVVILWLEPGMGVVVRALPLPVRWRRRTLSIECGRLRPKRSSRARERSLNTQQDSRLARRISGRFASLRYTLGRNLQCADTYCDVLAAGWRSHTLLTLSATASGEARGLTTHWPTERMRER